MRKLKKSSSSVSGFACDPDAAVTGVAREIDGELIGKCGADPKVANSAWSRMNYRQKASVKGCVRD